MRAEPRCAAAPGWNRREVIVSVSCRGCRAISYSKSEELNRMVGCFDDVYRKRMLKILWVRARLLFLKEMEYYSGTSVCKRKKYICKRVLFFGSDRVKIAAGG